MMDWNILALAMVVVGIVAGEWRARVLDRRRAHLDMLEAELKEKARALLEFSALWSYGAHREAVDVLEAAGIEVNGKGKR